MASDTSKGTATGRRWIGCEPLLVSEGVGRGSVEETGSDDIERKGQCLRDPDCLLEGQVLLTHDSTLVT